MLEPPWGVTASRMLFAVGTAPEVLEPLSDLTVVSPDKASLTCSINAGEPTATLRWYKNSQELKAGKRYEISYDDTHANLTILDTITSDSDQYRCEAVNKIGRVETTGRLTINSKLFAAHVQF